MENDGKLNVGTDGCQIPTNKFIYMSNNITWLEFQSFDVCLAILPASHKWNIVYAEQRIYDVCIN
jgi:hypothetical protein